MITAIFRSCVAKKHAAPPPPPPPPPPPRGGVLAKILHQAGLGKRGLIVVCTAGGMGVATIFES